MPLRRLFLLLLMLCYGCDSKPATLFDSDYDERQMQAAIGRARREVDWFLGEMRTGRGSNWSVKVPIKDEGNIEHFWLTDISYQNGQFSGLIGNDPGIVSNVSFGDQWTIHKSQISDWMFVRGGKIYGNYTLRPLLKSMPPEEARQLASKLATR